MGDMFQHILLLNVNIFSRTPQREQLKRLRLETKTREGVMKITRDNTLVELTPESPQEAQELDALWRVIVDCAKFNKKLVPVGEYIPGEKEVARFNIEE